MNCNINKTTNNMSNVYGPEFDRTTEEIINTIKKVSKLEVIDLTFNPIDVEIALYNNDYYVRPGANKARFKMECAKAFGQSKSLHSKTDEPLPYFSYIFQVLGIIKKFFDKAYFEEQIKRRNQSAAYTSNKDKLRAYLKKMDKEKLELFLDVVITCRLQHGLFITDVSSAGFWERIHESCRAAGVNVPKELDTIEGQTFLKNNPRYYSKALSTKVIANMLCDAIDLDVEMATATAKKLYTSGCDTMLNYLHHKIGI